MFSRQTFAFHCIIHGMFMDANMNDDDKAIFCDFETSEKHLAKHAFNVHQSDLNSINCKPFKNMFKIGVRKALRAE